MKQANIHKVGKIYLYTGGMFSSIDRIRIKVSEEHHNTIVREHHKHKEELHMCAGKFEKYNKDNNDWTGAIKVTNEEI